MCKMETSRWWWFHNHHHNGLNRSPWLQSTLSELDKKTKAMLNLIEEEADSFTQRAELYCKKRPELITSVDDFYRTHRSLAELYDRAKLGHGTRLVITMKTNNVSDKIYESCSDTFDSEDYAESEVNDLEHEHDTNIVNNEVPSETCDDEVMRLREEIERLNEDNEIQKVQLIQKEEEKREVIRQLSLAIEFLKDENKELKKRFMKESTRKWNPIGFSKLKGLRNMRYSNQTDSENYVIRDTNFWVNYTFNPY